MCDKSRKYCAVPQCNSNSKNKELTFHLIPKKGKVPVKNMFGKFEMVDVRKAWQNKLKIGKPLTKYMQVCSLHFEEDDYIPRSANDKIQRRILKKTAVPSLNLPVSSIETKNSSSSSATISERAQRLLSRNVIKDAKYTCVPEENPANLESDERKVREILQHSEQDLEAAGALLQLQNTFLKIDSSVQVNTPKIQTISGLLKTNRDLSAFTGISSFEILDVIVRAVDMVYKDQRTRQLPIKDRIILVFTKLKLNMSYTSLSILFGITETLSKTYFCELIPILSKILAVNIPFPDSSEISKNIPIAFKEFKDVRIILDCTEIFVQKPKCLCCRIRFYSQYKSSQTIKFMTGVSPGGLITFVSKAFGGRASDKIIFEKSNLIEKLESGKDQIMVDKGFLIDDICCKYNIGLIRPPFLKNKKQLSPNESLLNRKIAAARVHIERSNQRLKTFKILSEKLNWNLVPYIDDIFLCICGLTNLSSPILANSRF